MNAFAKILVPATLAFAMFGAQAGTLEIDYPTNSIAINGAAASTASTGGFLLQPISEAAPAFRADARFNDARTAQEVRREAQQSRKPNPDYFA